MAQDPAIEQRYMCAEEGLGDGTDAAARDEFAAAASAYCDDLEANGHTAPVGLRERASRFSRPTVPDVAE